MIYDFRFSIFAIALAITATVTAHADETQWRFWLEPKFMRSPLAVPLSNSQKTDLVAGIMTEDGPEPLSKADFAALYVEREAFHSLAVLNTAYDMKHLRYRFDRDKRGIIRYGAIESDRPVVASAVLFPGFLDLWKTTLGEKVLIVVPNRFTAFIFPKLASDYLDYAPMVFRAYRETPYPVSVEVFEITPTGWTCLGAYSSP